MRHVLFALSLALLTSFGAARAFATPFEPATVPEQVEAVGHLDVDALRKTQLFTTLGGQAAIDAALDDAPPAVRPVVKSLARTVRSVSFWKDGDHGAVYVDTRDARALAQLIAKLPVKPVASIEGFPTYELPDNKHTDKHGLGAAFGGMLVLSDSEASLERALRVLGGKAASL